MSIKSSYDIISEAKVKRNFLLEQSSKFFTVKEIYFLNTINLSFGYYDGFKNAPLNPYIKPSIDKLNEIYDRIIGDGGT